MKKQNPQAFTLVELLTVVAIIALLISILVPTVQRAQRQAKEVAIKAQLHGITQGLEMFKSDFGYYPKSLPQTSDGVNIDDDRGNYNTENPEVMGAHRLAFALMGRDKLGCPAKTGATGSNNPPGLPDDNSDTGPDSITGWYYSSDGTFDASATWEDPSDSNWGDPSHKTARKGPYINPEGFSVVEDKTVDNNGYVWLLCDKYNKKKDPILNTNQYGQYSTILYYKANDRGKYLTDQEDADGHPIGVTDPNNNKKNQIYYREDNEALTDATGRFKDYNGNGSFDDADFFNFVDDPNAKISTYHMPHNKESFLLITPGWDHVYGTDDDIVNWEQ